MAKYKVQTGSGGLSRSFDFQALLDLLIVIVVLVAVKQTLLPWSFLLAGPASTLSAMIVATWLLWRRSSDWTQLGLRWPDKWSRTAILTAIVFLAIAVTGSLFRWLTGLLWEDLGASGRFDFVEGNSLAYLMMLVLVWTHGSIFEELLFRAFIIDRASAFLGRGLGSGLIAALLSAIFFGYRHYYYQGMQGAITTGAVGFSLSLLYLWFGRKNILPLILGHGIVNTISQTQRFLGSSVD